MARRVVLTCATMSVLAHAMAVTLWAPFERPTRPSTNNAAAIWRVSNVVATASAVRPMESEAPDTTAAAAPELALSSTALAPADTSPEPTPSRPEDIAPLVNGAELVKLESSPSLPTLDAAPQATPGGDYIPRPQLSHPPISLTPVVIAPPSGTHDMGRIVGILSLFINEQGIVDRVISTGPSLPPEFEQNAVAAFKGVRFTPGQLDGLAVKSRIRVEVIFDNTPIEPIDAPTITR